MNSRIYLFLVYLISLIIGLIIWGYLGLQFVQWMNGS